MEALQHIDPQVVFDSIYNGIIILDPHGGITYFNRTAERIFNMRVAEALGRYILEVLPNKGGKLIESLRTKKSFQGEKLKGQSVTLIANINPILFKEDILGVISVFQDISDIEAISMELDLFKNMKNWLDTIIDSSYDGLWICNRDGKVIRINKASERINNVKAEEVQGRTMKDLVKEGYFDKSITSEVLKRRASVTMIQKLRSAKSILGVCRSTPNFS